jgi:hypothetical protein
MTKFRYFRNSLRWLVLCFLHPVKTRQELDQYTFWFKQAQEAFERAQKAKTIQEFQLAKRQFHLAERRYRKHSKYICP